jgi:hypothetical protein
MSHVCPPSCTDLDLVDRALTRHGNAMYDKELSNRARYALEDALYIAIGRVGNIIPDRERRIDT